MADIEVRIIGPEPYLRAPGERLFKRFPNAFSYYLLKHMRIEGVGPKAVTGRIGRRALRKAIWEAKRDGVKFKNCCGWLARQCPSRAGR